MNNRLKQLRKRLKIKQGELANKTGILQQQLSKYERGENKPSADFLIKLIEKTAVNLNWLLTGEGEMFAANLQTNLQTNLKNADAVEIIYYENPNLSDTIKNPAITSIWLDRELVHDIWHKSEKNLRTLQMPGDTMDGSETPIKNKDMLLIDISDRNTQASGIFVCTTREESLIFVNLVKQMPDGSLKFSFKNDKYKEVIYTDNQLKKLGFKVIGRVIKNMTACI